MSATLPTLKFKLQIYCGAEIAMGPGKAALLEAIGREGSISAAARVLGMSYRRAWLLADTMNRCWQTPLVSATPGGKSRGGAKLTEFGAEVLRRYQSMLECAAAVQSGEDWAALQSGLLSVPKEHQ